MLQTKAYAWSHEFQPSPSQAICWIHCTLGRHMRILSSHSSNWWKWLFYFVKLKNLFFQSVRVFCRRSHYLVLGFRFPANRSSLAYWCNKHQKLVSSIALLSEDALVFEFVFFVMRLYCINDYKMDPSGLSFNDPGPLILNPKPPPFSRACCSMQGRRSAVELRAQCDCVSIINFQVGNFLIIKNKGNKKFFRISALLNK